MFLRIWRWILSWIVRLFYQNKQRDGVECAVRDAQLMVIESSSSGLKYTVDKEKILGTGASGPVWLGTFCSDEVLKKVAVKCATSYSRQEFAAESILLQSLNCLFIVKLLDTIDNLSGRFFVMEHCLGNLTQYIHRELKAVCSLDPRMIVGQVAIGLSYLHEKNIIHKDLKPDNILMWQGESDLIIVKLADFGNCRKLPENQEVFNLTRNLGTSGFIAPELWNEERPSFSSDIWALGVVIFFVASDGQHPFGDSIIEAIDWRDELIKMLQTVPNLAAISDQWDAFNLVNRMLSFDPKERPSLLTVLLHPYLTLSTEVSKSYFSVKVTEIMSVLRREVEGMLLAQFFDSREIEQWREQLDPKLKRPQHETDALAIQELMKSASEKVAAVFNKILQPASWGCHGKETLAVVEPQMTVVPQFKDWMPYVANFDVLIILVLKDLIQKAPQLMSAYTWTKLADVHSKKLKLVVLKMTSDIEYAMANCSSGVFEQLLQLKNSELTQQEVNGLLRLACTLDLPDVVRILLHANFLHLRADPNYLDDKKQTALHVAAMYSQHMGTIQLLLEAGANPAATDQAGSLPLHLAAWINPNVDVVRLLVNEKDCKAVDKGKATALHYAAFGNANAEVLRLLLDSGSNPNAEDEEKDTPLHAACRNTQQAEGIRILLEYGADPHAKDEYGGTPFNTALINKGRKGASIRALYFANLLPKEPLTKRMMMERMQELSFHPDYLPIHMHG